VHCYHDGMSVQHLELVDYLAIAVEVTGLSVKTITRVALRLFIEINGWRWEPMPSVGHAEQAVSR